MSTIKNELNQKHLALVISNKTGNMLVSATNVKLSSETKYSLHAEAAALNKFEALRKDRKFDPKSLRKGVTVFSLRFNPRGELRGAKPCAHCENLLNRNPFVKCVFYS
jgi:hypothetical protein